MSEEVPPEFRVLLAGLSDESERMAVVQAYYGLAEGDPNTLPVQLAVLLKAHSLALLKHSEGLDGKLLPGTSPVSDRTSHDLLKRLQGLQTGIDQVNEGMRMLTSISSNRIKVGLALAYFGGLLSYPVFDALIGWVRQVTHL
ncbi:MAG: hypothetical protein WB586_01215 [Chthoniobacterales bacterium]